MSKRQPGTGGSNEGTGNILGVPNESTIVSRALSEGTGSKLGVPDKEKLILEWEADVDSEHFDRDDNAGDDNEETKPNPEEIYNSGPLLHEMTFDQIRSVLTPNRQETSIDNISSDLVSNKQKASDYDISGLVPPRKNVVSQSRQEKQIAQKEIEFLFQSFLKNNSPWNF
ncbi:hypothetical protein Tco_1455587 [Tanacetum coccineum]